MQAFNSAVKKTGWKAIASFAISFFCLSNALFSQQTGYRFSQPDDIKHKELADSLYSLKAQRLIWFQFNDDNGLRVAMKDFLDSCFYIGLDKNNYHYKVISATAENAKLDSNLMYSADVIYTDALISLAKDIYHGKAIKTQVSYDELTGKNETNANHFILASLAKVTTAAELLFTLGFFEPVSSEYKILKQELRSKLDSNNAFAVKQISHSLNILRWINHFGFRKYILVNPASLQLNYYNDTLGLTMKIVVGTIETPTPRFAAYCNEVILYPYWFVPYSIAVKELLPAIKRNTGYLDSRNMQVVDAKGRILDPYSINWKALSSKHFPYQLRQSTGCDNALGVIKFNLTDPYSVYMHDTNNKTAFLAGARYFSHGCIRLEKPMELADLLLPNKIDKKMLEKCLKDQKPKTIKLPAPVPVFVVYMSAVVVKDGSVKYYKDVYKLL